MADDVPDFVPPLKDGSGFPTTGGTAIDLYMEHLMTSTIVTAESPSSFIDRLDAHLSHDRQVDTLTLMEVEMIGDPDAESPRRAVWFDPTLVRSITHCPTDYLHRLENEIGFLG